jgi:hypothetical protein
LVRGDDLGRGGDACESQREVNLGELPDEEKKPFFAGGEALRADRDGVFRRDEAGDDVDSLGVGGGEERGAVDLFDLDFCSRHHAALRIRDNAADSGLLRLRTAGGGGEGEQQKERRQEAEDHLHVRKNLFRVAQIGETWARLKRDW